MQKYKLKNIDCASCAAKIETNLSHLKEVKYVSVNFADSTMFIDTDNINKIKKVIQQTEPGVEILDASEAIKESKEYIFEEKQIKQIWIILLVIVIFIIGLIFRDTLKSTPLAIGEYLVFLAAYLIAGWNVLYSAGRKILKGNLFDEHFLMSIATLGAIIIGELPEAVGVMIFYQVGEFLQQLSVKKSKRSIKSLLEIKPNYANLKSGNEIKKIAPEKVTIGELIIVKPGEKIPLDGEIIDGNSFIDTSPLTGESIPKSVRSGDKVLAGEINKSGLLTIKVTKLFENSSIAKIFELVENAAIKKAETEKFITRFSKYYTPVVVSIAILIAVIPPLFFTGQNFDEWIYRALVILVISCPCALVISIPLGYFGGIGGASKKGILVKGSNFLDALNKVNTVVFDKTGTLTKGVFKVSEIVPKNNYNKEELLRFAAMAEQQSNHPVAQSIREAYGKTLNNNIRNYTETPGYGIKAEVENHVILAGNDRLLHKENISHTDCNLNESVVHISIDGEYTGYLIISDELKEDTKHAIKYLRKIGIQKIYLLTGDNRKIAELLSDKLNLDGYFAELLPEEKVYALEKIIKDNHNGKVAFVGDGINDAPVIARADVGIAMGALGSDAAIESADIVLMTDTPSKIGTAIQHAKKTHKIVWQNIFFALGIKAFFILLGSFGVATMWEAVFADMGVALLAILNSVRILR